MERNNPLSRAASIKGNKVSARNQRIAREERWVEIDFLIEQGMCPCEIARHVGVSPDALSRQAYRWGWRERAHIFDRLR